MSTEQASRPVAAQRPSRACARTSLWVSRAHQGLDLQQHDSVRCSLDAQSGHVIAWDLRRRGFKARASVHTPFACAHFPLTLPARKGCKQGPSEGRGGAREGPRLGRENARSVPSAAGPRVHDGDTATKSRPGLTTAAATASEAAILWPSSTRPPVQDAREGENSIS